MSCLSMTMAHCQDSQGLAASQKQKTVFMLRMVRISQEQTVVVQENGRCFFE